MTRGPWVNGDSVNGTANDDGRFEHSSAQTDPTVGLRSPRFGVSDEQDGAQAKPIAPDARVALVERAARVGDANQVRVVVASDALGRQHDERHVSGVRGLEDARL